MENEKTIIITGGSDGIGAAAARQLKAAGYSVAIVGRNIKKTEKVAKELDIPYHIADYAVLSDVARLAEELKKYPHISALANNAGAALNERKITRDGIEQTFQINVLAPFLLTRLLIEKLCADKANVIQTASIAANLFGRDFSLDDIQNEKNYSPVKAYGEAKLCDVLFTRELNKRYGGKGINAVAFEPGVPRTNFASESAPFLKFMYHSPFKYLFTSSPKSAAKRLNRLLIGDAEKDFIRGETYSYKKPYKIKYNSPSAPAALWEYCEKLLSYYLK